MRLKPATILILCIQWFLFSCKNFNLTHSGDTYYYYPSKNVYYDVKRSNFLYSLDSGKTWDSVYSDNAKPAITGPREKVYSSTGSVWKDNTAHIKMYNGTVLNIINEESLKTPELLTAKKDRLENNKESGEANARKKERKRPVKKFFQKLFGKKSNDL